MNSQLCRIIRKYLNSFLTYLSSINYFLHISSKPRHPLKQEGAKSWEREGHGAWTRCLCHVVFPSLSLSLSFSVACLLDWTPHLVRALWNFSWLCPICLVWCLVTVHSRQFLGCWWNEQKEAKIDGTKEERQCWEKKTLKFLHQVQ